MWGGMREASRRIEAMRGNIPHHEIQNRPIACRTVLYSLRILIIGLRELVPLERVASRPHGS
jgi:hypothetical protein